MDTNEQIESLDDNTTVTQPDNNAYTAVSQTAPNVAASEPTTTATEPTSDANNGTAVEQTESAGVSAPQPVSLNDMVSPTDLQNTDINSFNQEGISLGTTTDSAPKPSSLESVVKSGEYNDIGKVPPNSQVEQKPKKKGGKVLLILLAIILIAGIGFGVYYYLGLGNKVKLSLKTLKVNVGESLSTNINDYVAIGTPDSSCVTNFDEVNVNTVGKYTYKIICNSGTFTGTIEIVDESAPTIYLLTPVVEVNGELAIDSFVSKCEDKDCHYTFVNEEEVKANLAAEGTYTVKINVSDDNNNSKEVATYMIVGNAKTNKKLICNSNISDDANNYTISDTIPIITSPTSGLVAMNTTVRQYIINYKDNESFNAAVATIKEDGTIETDIATGLANYIRSEKQIIITTLKTKEEMVSEFTDYPEGYSDLRNKYENDSRSFECQLDFGE